MKVIDRLGKAKVAVTSSKLRIFGNDLGLPDFISHSDILDESENILDSNGTLTVVVSIEEEPTTVYVPPNPYLKMMKGLFNDETTADVCFEVSSVDKKEGEGEKSESSVSLHPHRLILEKCAPMLAAICESNNYDGVVVIASVNDVKAEIFHFLLTYVYGGSIPDEELKTHAKDIIDAADKYSIVNLKLEAEAVYLDSTKFTFDNAMDNLLYADAKNCALLKETVLDFLVENSIEAINNKEISFTDFPVSAVKDLMVAFERSRKQICNLDGKDYSLMRVSELRRRLNAKGLDVDGSREAMIEALNNSEGLNHTAAEE